MKKKKKKVCNFVVYHPPNIHTSTHTHTYTFKQLIILNEQCIDPKNDGPKYFIIINGVPFFFIALFL